MIENKDFLIGWKNIANYFNVNEKTIMKWGDQDDLPYTKISGTIITTIDLLKRWIENKSKQ